MCRGLPNVISRKWKKWKKRQKYNFDKQWGEHWFTGQNPQQFHIFLLSSRCDVTQCLLRVPLNEDFLYYISFLEINVTTLFPCYRFPFKEFYSKLTKLRISI